MKISYKKLWKLLIDREISKGDFRKLTGISSSTSSKLNRGESVNTDVLLRICAALRCDTSDIMEVVFEDTKETADIHGDDTNIQGNEE
ncbi:MAG: helix-turn-helix transcriptional regulator [Clostridiales bacterium]|nr:helix-turn-helix transcriptional regulator [Clostridiales bacterium]